MSSKSALEVMAPNRVEPNQKIIETLKELLERVENGEIHSLGVITECLNEDGTSAVDWNLVGEVVWPTALYGAAMMLADAAKEVVREKVG